MAHPLVSPPQTAMEDPLTRPQLHISKSFSRYEPPVQEHDTRQRAATMQSTTITDILTPQRLRLSPVDAPDVFEKQENEAVETPVSATDPVQGDEEIPIELVSLTDRFIDSIVAKAHPTPPTVEKLAPLFQDFYALAATHIATHISTLSMKQKRQNSQSRTSSRSSSLVRFGKTSPHGGTSPSSSRPGSSRTNTQQMLTTAEMNDRRNQRKLLETKRVSTEEAVEKRVCEGTYDKIFKHQSTQDDERDEKLRSRTAALSVVGVGLKELGVKIDVAKIVPENPDENEAEVKVREWLAPAREALMKMNDEHYPLGKLQHLKAAHKAIVDTLSQMFPASSSADEILPMLIYTLITTPAEGTSVISNLNFTQRFRNENKIDGEAAYCLTNLEAAITFVETVDLSTLKADEHPSGPPRSRSSSSAVVMDFTKPEPTSDATKKQDSSASLSKLQTPETAAPAPTSQEKPAHQSHQRRISQLLQPPTQALGVASDVVMSTADQGIKTIGTTLENSYKFLFGRLKERQVSGTMEGQTEIIVPKTLDEARKLVSTPPPAESEDKGLSLVAAEIDPLSVHAESNSEDDEQPRRSSTDERLLSLIGGRSMVREGSRDSSKSGSSAKKVAFQETTASAVPAALAAASAEPATPTKPVVQTSASSSAVDTMRSLGNSLNPLNRLSSIGIMRPFGRSTSSLPLSTPTKEREMLDVPERPLGERPLAGYSSRLSGDFGDVADLTSAFPDLAPSLPPKEVTTTVLLTESSSDMPTPTQASVGSHPAPVERSKIAAPSARFMALESPGDLRLGEVLELLRDYRRLAKELEARDAFV